MGCCSTPGGSRSHDGEAAGLSHWPERALGNPNLTAEGGGNPVLEAGELGSRLLIPASPSLSRASKGHCRPLPAPRRTQTKNQTQTELKINNDKAKIKASKQNKQSSKKKNSARICRTRSQRSTGNTPLAFGFCSAHQSTVHTSALLKQGAVSASRLLGEMGWHQHRALPDTGKRVEESPQNEEIGKRCFQQALLPFGVTGLTEATILLLISLPKSGILSSSLKMKYVKY